MTTLLQFCKTLNNLKILQVNLFEGHHLEPIRILFQEFEPFFFLFKYSFIDRKKKRKKETNRKLLIHPLMLYKRKYAHRKGKIEKKKTREKSRCGN